MIDVGWDGGFWFGVFAGFVILIPDTFLCPFFPMRFTSFDDLRWPFFFLLLSAAGCVELSLAQSASSR